MLNPLRAASRRGGPLFFKDEAQPDGWAFDYVLFWWTTAE
jgi:hypothetical protein